MEPLGLAIDFGSTRTKVAYFNSSKNEARLIELGEEDRNIIPSVFYIPKEGNPSVGDDALMMVDHDPEGIVIGLKREIHRSVMVRCGPGRPPIGRVQLASEIFSYIRRKCQKEVFFEKNINLDICTLTVPVSFVEQQRDCIRKAAELAGFKHIMLIEEPVAAARAWLSTVGKTLARHVIICDAGGGTTDFGLLRYEKGRFESVPDVPTEGFPSGGNDIDESILDRVLEAGTYDADSARNSRGAFLVKIRKAKELFARHPASEKQISLNGITLQVPLKAVKDSGHLYIKKTVEELRSFLDKCSREVTVHEIPILLVGGGSRLSGLKEAIEGLAPGRVFQWNHSDYATVLGAATPLLKPVVPTTVPKPNKNLQGYREIVNNFIDKQNFTIKNLEDLTRMSTKLRLSKEEASQIETEVFGMTKELFYDLSQKPKLKENLSRYREGVAARNFLGINNFTIIDLKHLTGMSTELRLSKEQASQIETEVLGMTKEHYYDLSQEQKLKEKEKLSKYREEVAVKAFLGSHNFTIKDLNNLTRMSNELGLSEGQASQIETEVLGMPKKIFYDSRQKGTKNSQAGLGWSKPVQFPKPKGEPPTIPKVEIQPQGTTVQKAGEVITNELGMKFAWIPSGTFVMGSPESEAGRSSNETSHKVTITKGFYLGVYTVTQVQWEGLMGSNPSTYKGADLPVYGVSWEDCQEFIKKLNAKTNGGYRLPTESEWEYACRAGSTTVYSFGDVITLNDANYCSSILVSIFTLFFLDSPKAVGSYKSNAFGLHDMHGNVEEWCEDWYADYPAGAVTDPKGPATGTYRVLRGGSFHGVDSHARSSSRSGIYQGDPLCTYGFRLARTP